jgi:hypothetical protein
MRARSWSVVASVVATLAAVSATAQTVITGKVADSIAGRPLQGASVQLVVEDEPMRMRAVPTDSDGAYRFDAVPPGRYLLGFLHWRLDDLALQPPIRRIEIHDGERDLRANFAIPAPTTLTIATCGARRDSTGLFMGRIRDADTNAPIDSGLVTVGWREFQVDSTGLHLRRRTMQARVTPETIGGFALCGVPGNVPVIVQAVAGDRATSELELVVPTASLLQRDLLVANTSHVGRGVVSGRVLGPDNHPLARALVEVGARTDTTDASGVFALSEVPLGTHSLEARALGFSPERVILDVRADTTAIADVRLDKSVPELEAVTVFGRAPAVRRDITGFLERQRWGFGRFITAEQIERTHANSLAELLTTTPSLRITYRPGGRATILSRGTRDLSSLCEPDVFLDGTIVHEGATVITELVRPREIAGIEVYASGASTPAEYMRGPCGAILLWTKRGRY